MPEAAHRGIPRMSPVTVMYFTAGCTIPGGLCDSHESIWTPRCSRDSPVGLSICTDGSEQVGVASEIEPGHDHEFFNQKELVVKED